MAEAQYAHHNTIDPATGYTQSLSYPTAFDAQKKTEFIKALVENGLGIYEALEVMGISHHTFFKHYHNDPQFKLDFDQARFEYGSRLDALSKKNAMNPRSVIERIFQLKSIFPERYADSRDRQGSVTVNISVDPQLLQNVSKRQDILEAEEIK